MQHDFLSNLDTVSSGVKERIGVPEKVAKLVARALVYSCPTTSGKVDTRANVNTTSSTDANINLGLETLLRIYSLGLLCITSTLTGIPSPILGTRRNRSVNGFGDTALGSLAIVICVGTLNILGRGRVLLWATGWNTAALSCPPRLSDMFQNRTTYQNAPEMALHLSTSMTGIRLEAQHITY